MTYKDKVCDLLEEINSLDHINFEFKGKFTLRVREYNNKSRGYPSELEISVMFIKNKLEVLPIEVIKHTFARISDHEDYYYKIFYKELLNFIIFSRSDADNTYIDIRGEKVIIRSIGDWLIKQYQNENPRFRSQS